jgi:hypothetical protein
LNQAISTYARVVTKTYHGSSTRLWPILILRNQIANLPQSTESRKDQANSPRVDASHSADHDDFHPEDAPQRLHTDGEDHPEDEDLNKVQERAEDGRDATVLQHWRAKVHAEIEVPSREDLDTRQPDQEVPGETEQCCAEE